MIDLTKLTQSERDAMPPYAPIADGLYVLKNGLIVKLVKKDSSNEPWKAYYFDTGKGYSWFKRDGMSHSMFHFTHVIGPYTPSLDKCESCQSLQRQLESQRQLTNLAVATHDAAVQRAQAAEKEVLRLQAEVEMLSVRPIDPEPKLRRPSIPSTWIIIDGKDIS